VGKSKSPTRSFTLLLQLRFTFKDIYRVKTFDASKNTSADDLAVIYLNNAVRTRRRIAVAIPSTEDTEDYYVSETPHRFNRIAYEHFNRLTTTCTHVASVTSTTTGIEQEDCAALHFALFPLMNAPHQRFLAQFALKTLTQATLVEATSARRPTQTSRGAFKPLESYPSILMPDQTQGAKTDITQC
jgi:hypothetical protein